MANLVTLPRISSDSSLSAYIRKVNAIPMLTLEEEQELTQKFWKEMDFAAAHKLVLSHLRLVVKIAQNFRSYELPLQDIISEGNLGLMKAVQKFSPEAGCRLATYAIWWIKAAIQEYILNSWTMLKCSAKSMKEKLFYKNREGNNSSSEPVGDTQSLSQMQTLSLDAQQDDEKLLLDFIPSQEQCHAEAIIDKSDKSLQHELLKSGMQRLDEREKDILYRRRLKETPDKLSVLAAEHGVSQERIRQIEERIIKKLRQFFVQHGYAQ